MKSLIFSLIVFLFARPVLSEFNQQGESDQCVIDLLYSENVSWEEASFSSQRRQRDIAGFVKQDKVTVGFQWQGDLVVLDEIPYSYPRVSRSALQKKISAERGP